MRETELTSDCSYAMAIWPVADKNSDDHKQVAFQTTGTVTSFDVEVNKLRYKIKSRDLWKRNFSGK